MAGNRAVTPASLADTVGSFPTLSTILQPFPFSCIILRGLLVQQENPWSAPRRCECNSRTVHQILSRFRIVAVLLTEDQEVVVRFHGTGPVGDWWNSRHAGLRNR
jgi:hypothetical protein